MSKGRKVTGSPVCPTEGPELHQCFKQGTQLIILAPQEGSVLWCGRRAGDGMGEHGKATCKDLFILQNLSAHKLISFALKNIKLYLLCCLKNLSLTATSFL